MRLARLKLLGTAFVALVAAGAALYFGLVRDFPPREPARPRARLPAETDLRLRCDASEPLAVTVGAEVEEGGFLVRRGRIAARRNGMTAPRECGIELWRARGAAAPAPAIVVSPILGGEPVIERRIARDLAAAGMHAVIVDRFLPDEPTFEAFDEAMAYMVAARRRTIDWLETLPEVDRGRIGAYGVSLGGIVTTMLAAVDGRVRAAVVVMGGGDLGAIVARSVEGEPRALRHEHGVRDGAPPAAIAAFEARAREVLRTCPIALAPYVDPASVFMVTTRRDTSVPTDCQLALHEALGRPEMISLPTGHYSAVIYLPYLLARCREFLARKLAPAPPGAPGAPQG